jgi:predicted nucleic acid-binding protein
MVLDTSIYIHALRQGDSSVLDLRRASHSGQRGSQPLWFSAVVLAELLIGAADKKARRLLLETEKEFIKVNRMLVPIESDWRLAGEVLSHVAAKYGYAEIRQSRMTNDALIAMSVARNGFSVLTKNPIDFQKIAEFRGFNWEAI